MKIKTEISAGCVVFKKFKIKNSKFKIKFALGKHSGYHKWVLPKGLIEPGENKITAAIRETAEELGLTVSITKPEPMHIAKYEYQADFKNKQDNSRRVKKYAESFDATRNKSGENKTKVKKTVYFYLAKYISGDISDHGWEMEQANWFDFDQAIEKLAFLDEKKAVEKAYKML